MATSAATVGVSPIPAGNDNSPRYDILINACSVDNVGDVDYYIDGVSYDSCGRSPGIGYVDGAYRVGSDGDCVNSGSDGIMHDSYGIAFTPIKFLTFALQTSATTTSVRAAFTRMVTSSATATIWVSRIPTELSVPL